MNFECRKHLPNHIKVKLEREPDITLKNMRFWLLGDKIFDPSQVKPMTLYMFMKRSMDKFRRAGSKTRKERSGGNSSISRQAVSCIKKVGRGGAAGRWRP